MSSTDDVNNNPLIQELAENINATMRDLSSDFKYKRNTESRSDPIINYMSLTLNVDDIPMFKKIQTLLVNYHNEYFNKDSLPQKYITLNKLVKTVPIQTSLIGNDSFTKNYTNLSNHHIIVLAWHLLHGKRLTRLIKSLKSLTPINNASIIDLIHGYYNNGCIVNGSLKIPAYIISKLVVFVDGSKINMDTYNNNKISTTDTIPFLQSQPTLLPSSRRSKSNTLMTELYRRFDKDNYSKNKTLLKNDVDFYKSARLAVVPNNIYRLNSDLMATKYVETDAIIESDNNNIDDDLIKRMKHALQKKGKHYNKPARSTSWDLIGFDATALSNVKSGDESVTNYIPVNLWTGTALNQANRGTCVGFAAVEFLRMGHSVYSEHSSTGNNSSDYDAIGDVTMTCYEYQDYNHATSSFSNFFQSLFGTETKRQGWEESEKGLDGSWLKYYYQFKANESLSDSELGKYMDTNSKNKITGWDDMKLGSANNTNYYTENVVQYPVIDGGDCGDAADVDDYQVTSKYIKLKSNYTRPISWSKKKSDMSISDIKGYLKNGPVLIAIHWRDDDSIDLVNKNNDNACNYLNKFHNGSNVWSITSPSRGTAKKTGEGHAVVIVGYCDAFKWNEENNGGFIVKNSWGSWNGNQGYNILTYDRFNADMKEVVWYNSPYNNEYDRPDEMDLELIRTANATTETCTIV